MAESEITPTVTVGELRSKVDVIVEAALWAVEHFEAIDSANAKMHCAPVRYSPITFRLARALAQFVHPTNFTPSLAAVLAHDGAYEEDRGR